MLARKYQLCPRAPPIHERIALQCAKNISKLAAALPKPCTRTGHLPVLVELRNTDEDVVYRYQVNLPPSCVDRDRQQMNTDEAKALSQQLNLPCLVHDRSSIPQDIVPLTTGTEMETDTEMEAEAEAETDAPQLVMMQDAVHVVHNCPGPDPYAVSRETISTFQNCAYAIGASKMTRDHFMSTLHEQQPSPMEFTVLWADKQTEEQDQPIDAVENHVKLQPQLQPRNGYNLHQQQQQQQQEQQLIPHHLKRDQPQQKVLNGYKHSRKSVRVLSPTSNNNDSNIMLYQQKRAGNSFGLSPHQITPRAINIQNAQNVISIPNAPNGYNLHLGQSIPNGFNQTNQYAYCDPQEYARQQSEQREYFNMLQSNQQQQLRPIFGHMSSGNSFEYQRDLQLRQNLEHELENQKLVDQQKYKRMLADSLLTSQTPPELQSMFHWDCCHLCHTAMRTMRNALDHYLSRTHQRRVDSWLIRYSFVKGNLSEDMLRHLRSSGPAVLHCDLCDLKLTSVIHARQHFYGRRHRLVERHISKPNGEGYYDKTGRWVRTNDKWLMCKLCDVIVTSESQLAIHMAGVRHRKRERSTCATSLSESFDGSHVYRINPNGSLAPLNPLGYYMYAGCGKQDVRKFNDLNAAYYCEVCNITLNHLKSVKQHEEGRTHRKRLERVTQAEYV
ncbi:uncharacterized protein LOC117782045 [Drosophila innubila]|uniref:uncharacterized protein LOC117782045 n=1 Tax=Drosophila innubila TaxID=198719 RepID=UPI00148C138C|nr:uncharacterized protein LOC117782045 [Drosophila innubila]